MTTVIKSNIAEKEAMKLYPNERMVLLVEDRNKDDDEWVGDLVFVGTSKQRRDFLSNYKPLKGYTIFIFEGEVITRENRAGGYQLARDNGGDDWLTCVSFH